MDDIFDKRSKEVTMNDGDERRGGFGRGRGRYDCNNPKILRHDTILRETM